MATTNELIENWLASVHAEMQRPLGGYESGECPLAMTYDLDSAMFWAEPSEGDEDLTLEHIIEYAIQHGLEYDEAHETIDVPLVGVWLEEALAHNARPGNGPGERSGRTVYSPALGGLVVVDDDADAMFWGTWRGGAD